jgi:ATP-dependent protease Clp ATPase subunit
MLGRYKTRDPELRCSFWHKSQKDVGKLISSPDDYPRSYICDECIAVCNQILEDEKDPKRDPIVGNPLLSEFLGATEQWIAAESKGHDVTEQLSQMRRIAHLMFADSSEQ